MEEGRELGIHQVLHGYADGHTLLATSVNLSNAEKKTLLGLSDLSGPSIEQNFETYLTGYPLIGSNYYAFARTWYASEMPRPGCVWTHTLLINFALLGKLRNLQYLNTLFKKPVLGSYSDFNTPIEIDSNSEAFSNIFHNTNNPTLATNISFFLYTHPKNTLVISTEVPLAFEDSILELWNLQWPRLRRNFSFCTGSLSLRSINNEALDLQIIPSDRERSISRTSADQNLMINIDDPLYRKSIWPNNFSVVPNESTLEYMYQYGSDVLGERAKYLSLIDAYKIQMLDDLSEMSFDDLFDFLNTRFPSPQEGKLLKRAIIIKKIAIKEQRNLYNFLVCLFTSPSSACLSLIDWNVSKIIQDSWVENTISKSELNYLLSIVDETKISDGLVGLLSVLPLEVWSNVEWIKEETIRDFVSLYPDVSSDISIWKSSLNVQRIWFKYISASKNVDWPKVVKSMLEANSAFFASNVVSLKGPVVISVLLSWIGDNSRTLQREWEEEIKKYPVLFFNFLPTIIKYNSYNLGLLTKLFSPNHSKLNEVSIHTWTKFIARLGDLENSNVKNQVYTFLLSASFQNNLHFSEEVVSRVFQKVHNIALVNQLDSYSWSILSSLVGKDIYQNKPDDFISRLLKIRSSVPEWDKCEYLRRILVYFFMIYKWDKRYFLPAITDKNSFKLLVQYLDTSNNKRHFARELMLYIEKAGNKNYTYQYNELQKIFK